MLRGIGGEGTRARGGRAKLFLTPDNPDRFARRQGFSARATEETAAKAAIEERETVEKAATVNATDGLFEGRVKASDGGRVESRGEGAGLNEK